MLTIVLASASALLMAIGIGHFGRVYRQTGDDGPGRAMSLWILIFWWAIALIPALGSAGLVIAWFPSFGWPIRLLGLAPLVVILIPIIAAIVLWKT